MLGGVGGGQGQEVGWIWMEGVWVLSVLLSLFLYSLIYGVTFLLHSRTIWGRRGLKGKGAVLIAIAHPDDEVMFFGPTILNLLRQGRSVHLVCFSYGDAEGLGWTRKKELWKSCKALGIPDENVTLIKHDHLKDQMRLKWPILPISLHIRGLVNAYDIDTVITFDGNGVSGHLNHISIYNAVLDLIERNLLPKNCDVYTLKSVGFIRQYFLNVFNIPVSYYLNHNVLVARGGDYKRIVKAMKTHKSQLLWFRRLHIFFSMYLFLNILHKIPKPKKLSPRRRTEV